MKQYLFFITTFFFSITNLVHSQDFNITKVKVEKDHKLEQLIFSIECLGCTRSIPWHLAI